MWCICEWRSSSDNYCGVMEWLDLSHWSLWIPLCLKVEVFCFPCKQLWIRSCHWKIRVLSKCLSSFRITQDKHYGVASPSWSVAQMVKRLSAMQETRVRSLGWEDPLEKEMAAHSSILAWKIPWTAEPGRLLSMGSQRVGHDWATSFTSLHFDVYMQNRATSIVP